MPAELHFRVAGRAGEAQVRWAARMCLEIELEMPANDPTEIERLKREIEAAVPIGLTLRHFSKRKHRARVTLAEAGQGCACSLLADDANWEDEHWKFRVHVFSWLAKAVASITSRKPAALTFTATWLGPDRHNLEDERLSATQLLAALANGKISPRKKYITLS